MNNIDKISGGKLALRQAVEFKKHLLKTGYDSVDLCMSKEHEIFAIACQDNLERDNFSSARQGGGLDLTAFKIGDSYTGLGHVEAEHKIAKYIGDVYSNPIYKNHGIGKLLVSRTIKKLENKISLIDPIFLFVRSNCIASNYYDQFGFEDFDKYGDTNPNYTMHIKEMNVPFANKILTRDRFGLARTESFVADGQEIYSTKLAIKR